MSTVTASPGPRPWFHAPQTWIAHLTAHPDWLAALTLLFLVALLWVPFGLNVGFVSDGWQYFFEADYGGVIPLPLRPFTLAAWRIAYLFSPESFVGFNLLLAGLIYAKVLLIYRIIIELKGPVWFAFITAVLCTVLPADTAIFWLGTLQVHFALVCFMLAIWALIRFWNLRRVTSLIIMWLTLTLAVGTYEVVFALAALVPALLLFRNPTITRRWAGVSLLWYLPPIVAGLRYVYLLVTLPASGGYQDHLLDLPIPPEELAQSFETLIRRHFLDGWLVTQPGVNTVHLMLALIALVVVFVTTRSLVSRDCATGTTWPARSYGVSMLCGITIMFVGAGPFVITVLRLETGRTYFYTSIGAAILIAAALSWLLLHRFSRPGWLALSVAVLAGLGIHSQIDQHSQWVDWATRQQQSISLLVSNLGAVDPATTLVIVDDSAESTHQPLFVSSWYISNQVSVLYRDYLLRVILCYPEREVVWGSHFETCQVGEETLNLLVQHDQVVHIAPYDSVVLVRHLGDNQYVIEPDLSRLGITSDAYDPFRLIDPSAPPPDRLRTLFGIEAGA